MKIKLKEKDNGKYQATFSVDFSLGEIDVKEKDIMDGKRIIVQTGANVKQMKKLFRENLEQNINMYDKETRERFEDMLAEYVKYDLFEKMQLETIPPRVVLNEEGEVENIDGFVEGAEYEIIEE